MIRSIAHPAASELAKTLDPPVFKMETQMVGVEFLRFSPSCAAWNVQVGKIDAERFDHPYQLDIGENSSSRFNLSER